MTKQQEQFVPVSEEPPQGRFLTELLKNTTIKTNEAVISGSFQSATTVPQIKRLGKEAIDEFLEMHTITRMSLPEEQRPFMKELKRDILDYLIENDMPVLGLYVGGKMVSGAAAMYPKDPVIGSYLASHDFGEDKDRTAVVSAVWTAPGHGGKGYSKMIVHTTIDMAVLAGKDVIRAKVDKNNTPSLKIFDWLSFDTSVPGQDSDKVYPRLDL